MNSQMDFFTGIIALKSWWSILTRLSKTWKEIPCWKWSLDVEYPWSHPWRKNKRWSRLMLQSHSSSSWLIDTITSILTQEPQMKISWRTSNSLISSLWGLATEFFSSRTSLAQTKFAAGAFTAMEKELLKCAVQPLFMLLIEKTQK